MTRTRWGNLKGYEMHAEDKQDARLWDEILRMAERGLVKLDGENVILTDQGRAYLSEHEEATCKT